MDGTSVNNRTSVGSTLNRARETALVGGRVPAYPFLMPPEADGEIGRLGTYRILRLLGEGGMGLVFEAEDTSLRRPAAVKVMKQPPGLNGVEVRARFLREARAMAALKHDHLLTIYQVVEEGFTVYMAMELLRGETLEAQIRRQEPFPPAEICRIGREIAVGLAAIHEHGMIHRDIKPGNLWLEEPGRRVKILDFGLAREVNDSANLTQEGMVVGTPAYLSPEQARGLPADPLSDLFSLGCVMYRMCTGQLPFPAESTMGQLISVTFDQPIQVRRINPAIPEPLAALIHRLLAKDPFDRPKSAAALADAIRAIEQAATKPKKVARAVSGSPPSATIKPPIARPKPHASAAIKPPVTRPKLQPLPAPEQEPDNRQEEFEKLTRATRVGKSRRAGRKSARLRRLWITRSIIAVGVIVLVVAAYSAIRAIRKHSPPAVDPTSTVSTAPALPLVPTKPTPAAALPPPKKPEPETGFLTDLKMVDAVGWPFHPPKRGPGPTPMDFSRVVVNGKVSPHGLFMHAAFANEPPAKVSYNLGKQYRKFATRVSINDTAPWSQSPMTFTIRGDGRLLWSSQPVQSLNDEQSWSGSVEGVEVLTLSVTIPGAHGGAHGVWIEPELTK